MVKIVFLNLLRSKYGLHELEVRSGKFQSIFEGLKQKYPFLEEKDFRDCVMFVNGDRITHLARFDVELKDGDRVVLTHFLGGG